MASSEQLRASPQQHKPKNTHSKYDDKAVWLAMQRCIAYLQDRFTDHLRDYKLIHQSRLSFDYMINRIKDSGVRHDFQADFNDRTIQPDGGIIVLRHKHPDDIPDRIILISEIKRQGTNNDREREGKPRQAFGNAIERLGKNLIGIKAMFNHEKITPFVVFGWGCDFIEPYIRSKMCMLNEFYSLNKIYVKKRDGDTHHNYYSPITISLKETAWTADEMFEILKEVSETSLRHYLF